MTLLSATFELHLFLFSFPVKVERSVFTSCLRQFPTSSPDTVPAGGAAWGWEGRTAAPGERSAFQWKHDVSWKHESPKGWGPSPAPAPLTAQPGVPGPDRCASGSAHGCVRTSSIFLGAVPSFQARTGKMEGHGPSLPGPGALLVRGHLGARHGVTSLALASGDHCLFPQWLWAKSLCLSEPPFPPL